MSETLTTKDAKTGDSEVMSKGDSNADARAAHRQGVLSALRDYHRPTRQKKRNQGERGALLPYSVRSATGA